MPLTQKIEQIEDRRLHTSETGIRDAEGWKEGISEAAGRTEAWIRLCLLMFILTNQQRNFSRLVSTSIVNFLKFEVQYKVSHCLFFVYIIDL